VTLAVRATGLIFRAALVATRGLVVLARRRWGGALVVGTAGLASVAAFITTDSLAIVALWLVVALAVGSTGLIFRAALVAASSLAVVTLRWLGSRADALVVLAGLALVAALVAARSLAVVTLRPVGRVRVLRRGALIVLATSLSLLTALVATRSLAIITLRWLRSRTGALVVLATSLSLLTALVTTSSLAVITLRPMRRVRVLLIALPLFNTLLLAKYLLRRPLRLLGLRYPRATLVTWSLLALGGCDAVLRGVLEVGVAPRDAD
jgi:hypothetical protein